MIYTLRIFISTLLLLACSAASAGLLDRESSEVMSGQPPSRESQVTKANWLTYPYLRWAFNHTSAPLNSLMVPRAGTIRAFQYNQEPLDFVVPETKKRLPEFFDEHMADALIVVKGDTVLTEAYFNESSEHHQHIWFSMTKSLVSAVFGTLVATSDIDVTKSPAHYIPELNDSAFARTSIQHVLDHTSALGFEENYTDPNSDFQRFYSPALGLTYKRGAADASPIDTPIYGAYDFLATVKANPERQPGEAFEYNSSNTDVLGWLIARAANASLDRVIHDRIWSKIGAEHDAYIAVDRAFMPVAAAGFNSTLRDAARFGLMVRDFGRVGETQVLPRDWLEEITNTNDEHARMMAENAVYQRAPWHAYHNQWWILDSDKGEFCAVGVYGQVIYINRSKNLVAAWFSSQKNASSMASKHFMPKLLAVRSLAKALE